MHDIGGHGEGKEDELSAIMMAEDMAAPLWSAGVSFRRRVAGVCEKLAGGLSSLAQEATFSTHSHYGVGYRIRV